MKNAADRVGTPVGDAVEQHPTGVDKRSDESIRSQPGGRGGPQSRHAAPGRPGCSVWPGLVRIGSLAARAVRDRHSAPLSGYKTLTKVAVDLSGATDPTASRAKGSRMIDIETVQERLNALQEYVDKLRASSGVPASYSAVGPKRDPVPGIRRALEPDSWLSKYHRPRISRP